MVQFHSEQIAGNTPPFTNVEFPALSPSTFGHSAGQATISVGTVPFYDAPPFNSGQPISTEPYSSFGPVVSVFTANGQRRHKALTMLKPDVLGIDGINTSFFGDTRSKNQTKNDLPQFFGTSAAAPNVAAVAAMLYQLKSDATPAQITSASSHQPRPIRRTASSPAPGTRRLAGV